MIPVKTIFFMSFVVVNLLLNTTKYSAIDVALVGKAVSEKAKNIKNDTVNKIDTEFQKQYPDNKKQNNLSITVNGSDLKNPPIKYKQQATKDEQIPEIQMDNAEMNQINDFAKKNLSNDEDEKKNVEIERVYERKKSNNIKIVIKDIKESESNKVYVNLKEGYDALNEDKLEVAIYYYKKALAIDSKNKQALFGLGVAYQRLYQDQQAIDIYNKMLSYKQKDEKVINNLMIAMSNKDTKEALEMLLKIQQTTPDDPIILGQIGTTYLKMREYEKSIPYLTKAIYMSSDSAIFSYNLALAHDGLGNQDDALYYYQFALQSNLSGKIESSEINKIRQRVKDLQSFIAKKQKEESEKENNNE
jgi:Flp pilus assembly protein TadD